MSNPYVTIQNLYTVIGKKTVELDAANIMLIQYQTQIEALKKELKELKENGTTGLSKESD